MPDPNQAIILAGSGRSGTTWVGNIIAANPWVRVVFEPFDSRRTPEAAAFPPRPYARATNAHPEWYSFARDVLSGKIANAWIDQERSNPFARRILVKEIRVNMILDWLYHQFQPRIVYIVRHPCAVVSSRLRLNWENHLDQICAQEELVADYLIPFQQIIHDARSDAQKHAAMWAIENLVPLSIIHRRPWIFCTYEELASNPAEETRRILNELGMRFTPFTARAIRRISRVTRADSAVHTGQGALTAWQKELKPGEIDEILAIVRGFGITLYDERPFPNRQMLADDRQPESVP